MKPESKERLRDRRQGLVIVGAAFALAVAISWWARSVATPSEFAPPAPPTRDGLPGFPKAFEPIPALEVARTRTERKDLRGISLWGVKSDGTIDVSSGGNRVRYVFGSARGEGPHPLRPPGTLPNRDFCGKQNVQVAAEGLVAEPDQPTYPCSAQRGDPLPTPRCGPRDVWKEALKRGVSSGALATIEYFRAQAGPAWRFQVPSSPESFTLYGDCGRELTGAEAFGSVP